jgi:hypothetical protein
MKYYVGWDVGAWHCDRNAKSRDALCVLKAGEDGPEITGVVWRDNLKPKLNELNAWCELLRSPPQQVGEGKSRATEAVIEPDAEVVQRYPRC